MTKVCNFACKPKQPQLPRHEQKVQRAAVNWSVSHIDPVMEVNWFNSIFVSICVSEYHRQMNNENLSLLTSKTQQSVLIIIGGHTCRYFHITLLPYAPKDSCEFSAVVFMCQGMQNIKDKSLYTFCLLDLSFNLLHQTRFLPY